MPAASKDNNDISVGMSKKCQIESTDRSDNEVTQGPAATSMMKQAPKQKPKKRKKKQASTSDDDEASQTQNKQQPTADVNHFFKKLNVPSSNKKKVKCKSCWMVQDAYHKAKVNNFDSMLPDDTAAHCAAQKPQQSGMSNHFSKAEAQPKEALLMPYSNDLSHEVMIEWLIEMNQPIQAFDHLKFKKMMDIAV
ncbi:unnamed protein product [Cyclocybe aegerita]|uniref:Uncharacterized protein n=1 Tax=Cyclocybe aegerita TaxID=1973307 RepID=A0A8S0X727_CYCAE|nr:unnamed protein product [Cyclocybe aegerita]